MAWHKELLDLLPDQLRAKYWVIVVKRRPRVKWILLTIILLSFTGPGAGYWYMFKYGGCFFNIGCLTDDKGYPIDLEKLARSDFKRASYIYADEGTAIGMYFDEIRDPIRISEVPKLIRDAFIAAEDKRFYQHTGIDVIAIASAFVGNTTRALGWKVWKRSGGASTITQQFARLEHAYDVSDFKTRAHTLNRKIKEARLAIRLEKRYPKERILEGFLNIIWLGHGANGVSAGVQRYWGKDIRKEPPTIREAAILAAINKNSVLYDPIFLKPAEPKIEKDTSPEEVAKLREEYEEKLAKEIIRLAIAKDRYNFVLEQMKDNGVISRKEYEENKFQKDENPNTELAHLMPWKDPAYGYSNRIVKEMLLTSGHSENELSQYGGLKIYTTIDPVIQKIASEEFGKHLTLINQEKKPEDKLNGAFVIIEVKTGNIKAVSGGNNFDETQYNRALAQRSPGSGFKPFVYATAMENFGMSFFSKVCNCPYVGKGNKPGELWIPQNFKEKNPQPIGYIDLAQGIIWSLNLETINLARSIGMPSIVKKANSMGIHGNPGLVRDSRGDTWFRRPGYKISNGLIPGLPTAIGASEVNLIEMANAYAVFARGGTYIRPSLIKEIRDTYGSLLYKPKPSYEERVLSQETSDKMVALMRAVTKIGTAKISMRGIEQQVAVKTGTSDGPRDLGMYGFTPEYVLVIRVGHDDYRVIELPEYMRKVSGDAEMQVSGGWAVGPLFRKIIDRIYVNRAKVEFSENVEMYKEKLLDHYGWQ